MFFTNIFFLILYILIITIRFKDYYVSFELTLQYLGQVAVNIYFSLSTKLNHAESTELKTVLLKYNVLLYNFFSYDSPSIALML
jgi:hypothetical protein